MSMYIALHIALLPRGPWIEPFPQPASEVEHMLWSKGSTSLVDTRIVKKFSSLFALIPIEGSCKPGR
eukprot:1159864-Pelagomonas_calceolata.AAC.20